VIALWTPEEDTYKGKRQAIVKAVQVCAFRCVLNVLYNCYYSVLICVHIIHTYMFQCCLSLRQQVNIACAAVERKQREFFRNRNKSPKPSDDVKSMHLPRSKRSDSLDLTKDRNMSISNVSSCTDPISFYLSLTYHLQLQARMVEVSAVSVSLSLYVCVCYVCYVWCVNCYKTSRTVFVYTHTNTHTNTNTLTARPCRN